MLLMTSFLVTIATDCRQTLSKCVSKITEQLMKTAYVLCDTEETFSLRNMLEMFRNDCGSTAESCMSCIGVLCMVQFFHFRLEI